MIHRIANLSKTNSFFLFGARGVGKTSLITERFTPEESLIINLLLPSEFNRFLRDPEELLNICKALSVEKKWVILDEIQKVPTLLDVVHQLIETTRLRFVLTGSSSRKLKRGGGNLLAGRAFVFELFPFTSQELGDAFNLREVLQWGALPMIFKPGISNEDRELYLKAYTQTYLKEEIQEEQLVRNLRSFYLFLDIAAQMNGKILNYSKIAKDIGIDNKTVQSYFDILEETHIGFRLHPFRQSLRKRQREHPKFYFFDIGIQRSLQKVAALPVVPGTYEFGNTFEHFIILECHRLSSYLRKDFGFSYLQTHHDMEVDLIIERPLKKTILFEIKSTTIVKDDDVATLKRIKNDFPDFEYICLSLDVYEKNIDGIQCMPWQKGLEKIFGG